MFAESVEDLRDIKCKFSDDYFLPSFMIEIVVQHSWLFQFYEIKKACSKLRILFATCRCDAKCPEVMLNNTLK